MQSDNGLTSSNGAALAEPGELATLRTTVDELSRRAKLLDLAHDTIMERRLDGTITYWNKGAERMYGYSAAEAIGSVSHKLLSTVFPLPVQEIEQALLTDGFWEGELIHTGRERRVTVDSRWVLDKDNWGAPRGVLEINLDISQRKEAEAERMRQAVLLQDQAQLLDLARDAIVVRRLDGEITYWNKGAADMYGYAPGEAVGSVSHLLLRTGFPTDIEEIERELLECGHWQGELVHSRRDGTTLVVDSRWVLRRQSASEGGNTVLELNTDVTARKEAEAARARQQQEFIRAQAHAIEELSTPLIPITDEIFVMPLIGVMDSARAAQVMETLLHGISSSRGEVVIVDVTGVPVVDTQVANALVRAAQAVQLLGAEVVLTGIRSDVAQTLVSIGAELTGITTYGTLQTGVAYALRRRVERRSHNPGSASIFPNPRVRARKSAI